MALLAYVAGGDERERCAAYELGRAAVADGFGVLDLADAHHEALGVALCEGASPDAITGAAGEFLLDSLSAFEMVQRGGGEAREAAESERRHAAMLRQLSTFLADASLAGAEPDATHEILHLVAEEARELIGAACCVAALAADGAAVPARAASFDQSDAGWAARLALADLAQLEGDGSQSPHAWRQGAGRRSAPFDTVAAWLGVPLLALDGRGIGFLHLFERDARTFTVDDEAVLVQLAQMASAAVERARLYRQPLAAPRP